MNSRNSYEFD